MVNGKAPRRHMSRRASAPTPLSRSRLDEVLRAGIGEWSTPRASAAGGRQCSGVHDPDRGTQQGVHAGHGVGAIPSARSRHANGPRGDALRSPQRLRASERRSARAVGISTRQLASVGGQPSVPRRGKGGIASVQEDVRLFAESVSTLEEQQQGDETCGARDFLTPCLRESTTCTLPTSLCSKSVASCRWQLHAQTIIRV